ncbi:DUF6923 family protein [Dyadobacter alkalitolerans]|uniref:DUF6923 family protein n=1 Tax=Dyadobacter alkalitolerans TaxID=492736 RepID=UPI001B7F95B3|nr:T9SS type A sorting domain-containing protein [Dyadobacter alkalitolerans]
MLFLGMLCYGAAMAVNISGTAWVDANGNGLVDSGETSTDFGGTMYVNVVNASGAVIASTQVASNGTYSFTGLPNTLANHKLVLTNSATNRAGNRIPGVYYVFEDVVGPSNTANQANAPLSGEIALATQGSNMANQNFRMSSQSPFGCIDGIAYQVSIPAGATTSSLYSFNISSGGRTQIGASTPHDINSLIYSTASNNFLWGTVTGTNDIVRIGAGAGTVAYNIANLPAASYNVGVELPNAYMLVYTTNAASYYVIDVDPARATFLELVDPTNGFALKAGPAYGTAVTAGFSSADMAYVGTTSLGYGITPTSNITTINPATGVVTTNPTPVTGLPNATYGGMFSDKAGKLYAYNNTTGGFYRIDPVTNSATLLSTSTPAGANDAASCPNAFVECDTDIPVVPADATLCPGTSTTFTVAPDGNGPFTYQWQQSIDGGSTWLNMQTTPFTGPNGTYSGAGTPTLTVTPTTTGWNNFRYRSQITSNLCTTPSSSATLNVFAIPGAPTLLAGTEAPVCPATTYNLNRLVLGPAPAGSTLRFYTSSTPSPATLVADPTVAPAGTYYARYENDGCAGPVSQPITITGCLTPFSCEDGVAYQVAAADGEPVSSLYAYNVTTGTRTLVAPLSSTVNSLVYSEVDNTLWATVNGTNILARIDANGTLIQYPITNLPAGFNVGAALPGGYMLVYGSNQTTYYVVDIDPSRSTYLKLVDPANNYALQTGPTYGKPMSAGITAADLVYEKVTGMVYGIETGTGRLVTLNHITGATTLGSVIAGIPTGTGFGAVFADPSGKLYAFANDPGTFHRINIVAGTSVQLSTSITSNSNDGASCPNSILENLPFACTDGVTYQVAAADGETVSTLYAYNVNTGARTEIAPLPMTVNSLVYNSADNMLWATRNGTNSIVQIDREGGTVEYPIANLPSGGTFNVGVELPNGYMMIYSTGQSVFYVIDVDANRPASYLKLVDPTNGFALQTGPTYGIALSAPFAGADVAYLPSTQLIYGFTTDARISTINPLTGAVTVGGPVSGLPGNSAFGAVFADATGKLYSFHNESGSFYKIDPVNNSASFMTTSIPSNSNDGANCVTATICDIELTKPSPESEIICEDKVAVFTVTATGTGTITYQWQVSTDGGSTWTDLAAGGATDANGTYSGAATNALTLTPANTVWDDNRYRVVVDSESGLCTLTSSPSLLSVRTTAECALPVTLVSFTVSKEAGNTAVLNWSTTEETNSDRFEIQSSTDSQTWKTIGAKTSHGESTVLRKYDFVDQAPAAGLNYYRLKMVDKDETFAYSSVRNVRFADLARLSVYPNPVSERFHITNHQQIKQIAMHNQRGMKVFGSQGATSEGIDVSRLTPGLYTVTLTLFDGTISTHKVAVTR